MALLEVQDIRRCFGGLVALDKVTFTVSRQRIKSIIGPNGAGKTTLFNIISGILRAEKGTITFDGRNITGMKPYQVANLGISRTFQTLNLFPRMTVLENVMIGRHCRTNSGMFSSALTAPGQRHEEKRIRENAAGRLEELGLGGLAEMQAVSLSFGQRRMVELARALSTEPTLLLLDEPASGLNNRETDELAKLILRIRDSGITILLVEHDMSLVMDISDDILVLNYGVPIAEGSPTAIRNNSEVISVYLGGELQHAER